MTTDARALRDKVTQAGARAGGAAQAGAAQEQSRGAGLRRADLIAALGSRIARIENRPPAFDPAHETSAATGPVLSLGMTGIDAMLAGREAGTAPVPAAALHEVRAETALDAAAATGFALGLGQRAIACTGRRQAAMFWIAGHDARNEAGLIYGPGLEDLGLGGIELVRVFANGVADALWAAGEVAAHKGAGLCLLELRANPARADLAFSRRLALRAREAGVPVIVLRQGGGEEASAALTRWRVAPAPSDPGIAAGRKWLGPPAFAVTLEKCRGGRPGEWLMEWKSDERLFAPAGSGNLAAMHPAGFPVRFGAAGSPLSLPRPSRAFDRPSGEAAARSGLAARRAS